MEKYYFIFLILFVLILIKLYFNKDYFDTCSQYSDDYNKCYASGNCTIMIDLDGTPLCTSK